MIRLQDEKNDGSFSKERVSYTLRENCVEQRKEVQEGIWLKIFEHGCVNVIQTWRNVFQVFVEGHEEFFLSYGDRLCFANCTIFGNTKL